jgi:hypothetical protein
MGGIPTEKGRSASGRKPDLFDAVSKTGNYDAGVTIGRYNQIDL